MKTEAADWLEPGSASRLVIVGASLAGLRAAEAARREGWVGRIIVIGAEDSLPYDRLPLSKAALTEEFSWPPTPFRSGEQLMKDLGLELLLGAPAISLDLRHRVVTTTERQIPFDRLVLATGAELRTLPGGMHLRGVHGLRTWQDAQALRASLDSGGRVVIIGGGFIGAEVASAAVKRGLDVQIIGSARLPLEMAVGPVAAEALADVHGRHGVQLHTGSSVVRLTGSEKVDGVLLNDGRYFPADIVVVGIGVRPATDWLKDSGLVLDNGIVCDERLQAAPGVFAAGDVARWPNPLFDYEKMRLEHWTTAAEQGGWAGRNAASALPEPFQTVPYFWSDWYGSRIQFLGKISDNIHVVGDLKSDKFAILYSKGARLVGVLGWNEPRVMRLRAPIVAGSGWQSVLESLQSPSVNEGATR